MLVALSQDLESRSIGLSYVPATGEASDIRRLNEETRTLTVPFAGDDYLGSYPGLAGVF